MPDEIRIRPSSLTGWLDCPRRAAASLFRGMVVNAGFELRELPRNVGAAIGTSVHKGAWYTLTEKMTHGGLGTEEQAIDYGVTAFRDEIVDGVIWDATSHNPNDADKHIIRMTKMHRAKVAPDITPMAVEERLEAKIGRVVVSGQKDVLAREPNDLRDLKTGAGKAAHTAQIGAYSLIERSHGREVNRLIEDFIPRVSLKRPQPLPLKYEYAVGVAENLAFETIEAITAAVEEFERRIETGDRPPENAFQPNPMSMLCGDKFCPAFNTKFCQVHKMDPIEQPEEDDF